MTSTQFQWKSVMHAKKVVLPVITFNLPLLERTSSYSHLVRVTAWIVRLANNARKGSKRNANSTLSLTEIEKAEDLWWRIAEETISQKEIQTLNSGTKLSPKSRILSFHPFLDEHKLLCVGRRLHRAKLFFSECHPMLLPAW